jgi:hypothetical protein
MKTRRPARHGYALMLVMIFVVIFLAMLGVTWRQVASVLRIETVRQSQVRRDQGCLTAAVQGIHLLESAPITSSPYVWNTTVDGKPYTVTFTENPGDSTLWTVEAVPTSP